MLKEQNKLRMDIYKKIRKMKNKDKLLEILDFIILQKIDYTTNSSGIFVNLSILTDEQLLQLSTLIN
jgi:hypothetical protein